MRDDEEEKDKVATSPNYYPAVSSLSSQASR
jgi:hypothetical protein